MCRKVELLDKRMMLGVVVTQIVSQMMQFQQLHQHQIEMDSLSSGNLSSVQPTFRHLIYFITVQHQVGCESVMLVKKDVLVLNQPLMEKPMNQKPSLHQMEHYQKFYENGEYVRAVESTTEQNYNMIDGCANNLPKPRIINGRESVLDKLRIRQMAREKQKSSQEQSADMERNRK